MLKTMMIHTDPYDGENPRWPPFFPDGPKKLLFDIKMY